MDKTILVVEDDPNMRTILKTLLESMKLTVLEAENGAEAVRVLEATEFDLVICDWNMPKMNGIELLRILRTWPRHQQVPFLMLTVEHTREKVIEAAQYRVSDYALKTSPMKELKAKIVSLLTADTDIPG